MNAWCKAILRYSNPCDATELCLWNRRVTTDLLPWQSRQTLTLWTMKWRVSYHIHCSSTPYIDSKLHNSGVLSWPLREPFHPRVWSERVKLITWRELWLKRWVNRSAQAVNTTSSTNLTTIHSQSPGCDFFSWVRINYLCPGYLSHGFFYAPSTLFT